MRVITLVIELILRINRAGRILCRTGEIGDAVGPLWRADGTAGHGLADLDEFFVRPVFPCLRIVQQRQNALALHGLKEQEPRSFEQRRRNVDDAEELGDLLCAFKAWTVDEQRDADGAVMRAALVLLISRHEVAAVIADEDEDGVVGEVLLLKNAADTANGGIDALAGAIVVRELALPVARQRAKVGRNVRVSEAFLRTMRADRRDYPYRFADAVRAAK